MSQLGQKSGHFLFKKSVLTTLVVYFQNSSAHKAVKFGKNTYLHWDNNLKTKSILWGSHCDLCWPDMQWPRPENGIWNLNMLYYMLSRSTIRALTNMPEDIFCSFPKLYDAGELQTGNLHLHLYEHFWKNIQQQQITSRYQEPTWQMVVVQAVILPNLYNSSKVCSWST